jgi:hypothetical protein
MIPDSLPPGSPAPDYPPPIEAFEYTYRLADLLMVLVSLDQVHTAGREKGVEFVYRILKATYEIGFKDMDATSSKEGLAKRKIWLDKRAGEEADEVILRHMRLVYSLALIMACSTFELFLNHLLDVLLVKEPRVAGGRMMRLSELYDARDRPEVLARFREAEINEFERLGTKEKVGYFCKKCNIRREVLFSFAHCREEEGKRAKSLGEDFLYTTFGTRNRIAHKGELPITGLSEVADVVGFFQALVIQFSFCVGSKYEIRVLATSEEDVAWRYRHRFRELLNQPPGIETKTS